MEKGGEEPSSSGKMGKTLISQRDNGPSSAPFSAGRPMQEKKWVERPFCRGEENIFKKANIKQEH